MATTKKQAPTIAPEPPISVAEEPRISTRLSVQRVANGFIVSPGDDYQRETKRQVARNAAELGSLVATWAIPTPKKR